MSNAMGAEMVVLCVVMRCNDVSAVGTTLKTMCCLLCPGIYSTGADLTVALIHHALSICDQSISNRTELPMRLMSYQRSTSRA